MQKVVVVIPIHKPDPTKNELASFAQCYKILGMHPIRVVAPQELDTNAYTKTVPDAEFLFIDKIWLSSVEQYNKLKISLYFYNLFKDYEYLLTYELDAWVFRDELLYWCDKGYDYIGAPWFEGYTYTGSNKMVVGANSGFSLRSISATHKIVNRIQKLNMLRGLWFKYRIQSIFSFYRFIKIFGFYFSIKSTTKIDQILLAHIYYNEDFILTSIVPQVFRDYKVVPEKEAIEFSFEVNPLLLFQLTGSRLPFGCHAWERYDVHFWKQYIVI